MYARSHHPSLLTAAFALSGCAGPVEHGTSSDEPAADTAVSPGDSADPCAGVTELQLSVAVDDHGDVAQTGSAVALMASVPAGCECVLSLHDAGAYRFTSSVVFPSWTVLSIADGAWLDIDSGATVIIDGGIDAGRTQIFDGDGALAGAPLIDAAHPEWFGAVPDDEVDDHDGLQRAADFFSSVSLQGGVYDMASALVLSDGARLAGPEGEEPTATLRTTLVYPETGGFHPTRMLEAAGASDIAVRDLILDGDRHAHEEEPWDYPETDNLARFEDISGLVVERVLITGWEANWGINDQSYAHAAAVIGSEDIAFTDVSFTDSRTEGLLFQDSEAVDIVGLWTQNTDVWSPLNVFYVTGFSLTDSTIIEDEGIEWSGSTANLTVSDAIVSGNSFTGGWGLDFGDETGTTPFGPSDITVENNTIETAGFGIYFSPYTGGDQVRDVLIRDNALTVHRSTSSDATDVVIRLDAAADVVIEGNSIFVPGAGEALVQGISFRAETENIIIQDNVLTGVDAGITHSGDTPDGGTLSIVGNTITCASEIRVNSWNGGSTGVWIFRYIAARFDSITVENNAIEASGGWVSLLDYATLTGDADPFVDALTVTGNAFLPESGSERNISSGAADSVTISDNTPSWVNP